MQERKSLSLKEARELTPAVNPVEAMRRQLSMALFDAVKEQDVINMANKLKEMAQAGDLKAMRMYFELVLGKEQKPLPPPTDTNAVAQIAESLQDLVDEIRVTRARDDADGVRRKRIASSQANGSNGDDD